MNVNFDCTTECHGQYSVMLREVSAHRLYSLEDELWEVITLDPEEFHVYITTLNTHTHTHTHTHTRMHRKWHTEIRSINLHRHKLTFRPVFWLSKPPVGFTVPPNRDCIAMVTAYHSLLINRLCFLCFLGTTALHLFFRRCRCSLLFFSHSSNLRALLVIFIIAAWW